MTATESPFPSIINDFCNKIGATSRLMRLSKRSSRRRVHYLLFPKGYLLSQPNTPSPILLFRPRFRLQSPQQLIAQVLGCRERQR